MKRGSQIVCFSGDKGLVTYPLFIKSIKQQIANLTICCLIFAESWFATDFQKLCRKKNFIQDIKHQKEAANRLFIISGHFL